MRGFLCTTTYTLLAIVFNCRPSVSYTRDSAQLLSCRPPRCSPNCYTCDCLCLSLMTQSFTSFYHQLLTFALNLQRAEASYSQQLLCLVLFFYRLSSFTTWCSTWTRSVPMCVQPLSTRSTLINHNLHLNRPTQQPMLLTPSPWHVCLSIRPLDGSSHCCS